MLNQCIRRIVNCNLYKPNRCFRTINMSNYSTGNSIVQNSIIQYSKRSIPFVFLMSSATVGYVALHMKDSKIKCEADNVVHPYTGIPGSKYERTFIAIKPDGVQRGLIHEIIARFEKKGYKLVAMKFMTPTKERAREHYADLSSRPFFSGLVDYFTSGPVVCMVWEGTDVILTGRKILGATNPNQALPGTIRGDNCISTGRNLIHGSDGPESAENEIQMWFKPEEICDYSRVLDTWIVADN